MYCIQVDTRTHATMYICTRTHMRVGKQPGDTDIQTYTFVRVSLHALARNPCVHVLVRVQLPPRTHIRPRDTRVYTLFLSVTSCDFSSRTRAQLMRTHSHYTYAHMPHAHRYIRAPIHTRMRSYTFTEAYTILMYFMSEDTRTHATMYICTRTRVRIGKQLHSNVHRHTFAHVSQREVARNPCVHARSCTYVSTLTHIHTRTHAVHMCTRCFCQW